MAQLAFTAYAAHQYETLPQPLRQRLGAALERPPVTDSEAVRRNRFRPATSFSVGPCRVLLDAAQSTILAVYLTGPRD